MSDYKETNIIVQANDLVRNTNWTMNVIPLKIFKGMISCINVNNPPKDNQIEIRKSDLYKIVGIDKSKQNYTYLRRQMESLMQQIVYLRKDDKVIQLPLVAKIIWHMNSDEVTCCFDQEIMPYLVKMSGLFLQYPVSNLVGFCSRYGIILYENLLSRERQYKKGTYLIPIEELRHVTGTAQKYTKTYDFENYVLKTAVTDINSANVEFLVRYSTIKYGKEIRSIKFDIRPRTSCTEDNYETVIKPSLLVAGLARLQQPSERKEKRKRNTEPEKTERNQLLDEIQAMQNAMGEA